jgi:putative ABC transport system permease protein
MRFLRTLRPSLRTLLAHRVRSSLAATGVAIGIAAVLSTSAIGQGAEAEMQKNLGAMGTHLLVVRPESVKRTTARKEQKGLLTTLKLEDYQAISELPLVEAAAPVVEGPVKIKANQGVVTTTLLGTTSAFFHVRDFEFGRGRPFDDEEDSGRSRLVVLGGQISNSLFPKEDPVGQEVRISGIAFEVVGMLRQKGVSADGADADNQAFIPVHTAQRRLFDSRSLGAIFVGVRRPDDLDPVAAEIRSLLRERHALVQRGRPDDFTVQNQLRFLSAQRQTLRPLKVLTAGLAAISLLVGGTGILALMLLSVRERTPEIGLRMAVGARQKDILFQFLAEASLLSLVGGTAGIALGALGISGLSWATHWPLRVSMQALTVSLAMSATIGLVFGAFPAMKAARLPPVQALALE